MFQQILDFGRVKIYFRTVSQNDSRPLPTLVRQGLNILLEVPFPLLWMSEMARVESKKKTKIIPIGKIALIEIKR